MAHGMEGMAGNGGGVDVWRRVSRELGVVALRRPTLVEAASMVPPARDGLQRPAGKLAAKGGRARRDVGFAETADISGTVRSG